MGEAMYKGQALFSSGPYRVSIAPRGQALLQLFRLDSLEHGTAALGDLEAEVEVRGRLVAETEAALWLLRQAVALAGRYADGPGNLVDDAGRLFTGMRLVTYEEFGPADAGRVWSMGYRAVFRATREGVVSVATG